MIIDEVLGGLETATSVSGVLSEMSKISGNFDVASMSYVDTSSVISRSESEPYFETTVRDDFISSYVEAGFLDVDPVIRRSWNSQSPFNWFDCPEFDVAKTRSPGRRNSAGQILDLANDHGFRNGIIVPVHRMEPSGARSSAFISLYFEKDMNFTQLNQRFPPELWLSALYFHQRMVDLRPEHPVEDLVRSEQTGAMLTDREREALCWASRGKTASETADIMNVKPPTVAFFLKSAQNKLGVYNKTHAVAVALSNGLIAP
ncbi:MAG: LuxR family transcriptional regulator [Alphaproteobacteria bacterium]|nr:LuxR family transcriptional regulator [Alphaproteobacteria bacterium SS10]